MQALILIAHGSRNEIANDEVKALAYQVGNLTVPQIVTYAFLGVIPPTLEEAIIQVIQSGATQIDLLPLFLNTGKHVSKDIPSLLNEARQHYPDVMLRLLQHIGSHTGFVALIQAIAKHPEQYVVNNEENDG